MITCPRCGWENDAQDRVCAGCGAGLGTAGAATPPPPAPPRPPPPAAPPPAPAPQPVVPPPPVDRGSGVPQRTIPVRMAQRAPTTVPPAGPAPPRVEPRAPGQVGCRLCGRSVPAGRRFCACGAALSVVEPARAQAPARPPSWWREWSAQRSHRAAMRQAAGGSAPAYDAPLAPRVRLVRVGVVLLLVAVLGSQVGPWGDDLRQQVVERITTVIGSNPG